MGLRHMRFTQVFAKDLKQGDALANLAMVREVRTSLRRGHSVTEVWLFNDQRVVFGAKRRVVIETLETRKIPLAYHRGRSWVRRCWQRHNG